MVTHVKDLSLTVIALNKSRKQKIAMEFNTEDIIEKKSLNYNLFIRENHCYKANQYNI